MSTLLQIIAVFLALGVFFSFGLAFRSFTRKGIPMTSSVSLTGGRAKLTGIACLVLGLSCLLLCVIVVRMFLAIPLTR
jgi:hypothetical protein